MMPELAGPGRAGRAEFHGLWRDLSLLHSALGALDAQLQGVRLGPDPDWLRAYA